MKHSFKKIAVFFGGGAIVESVRIGKFWGPKGDKTLDYTCNLTKGTVLVGGML